MTDKDSTPHENNMDLCMPWVALCAWSAGWRTARDGQKPDRDIRDQVYGLIYGTDFIERALGDTNWWNINALLAAFADAGTMGSADVESFYAHVERNQPRSRTRGSES